ncbi:hypothetical protein C2845_PM06G05830 [Panicum miliaceum]|uniref:Uncharacterized protein n=1 Tax=Panicum miliaceum TaxID=4540 RepID=A0A3L6RFA7_PANMI|nr:hypothetical protein C2845_PM06G05830 [Panicum miliaceum]
MVSQTIEVGNNVKMRIADEDISMIIGTPVSDFFVQKQLPAQLNKEYENQFKIAFVIFIMGRFLAPTTDHCLGNWDFWRAFFDPDDISSFNWSGYVLSHIIDSARLIEFGNLCKDPISSITGCPLIIQIFYLDNLDLGPLNLAQDMLPRIKNFDSSTLSMMIRADTPKGFNSSANQFGRSRVRRADGSCYAFQKENQVSGTAAPMQVKMAEASAQRGSTSPAVPVPVGSCYMFQRENQMSHPPTPVQARVANASTGRGSVAPAVPKSNTTDANLSTANALMVPVNVKGTWVCYAWDLRDRFVNIIDQTAGRTDEDFIKMIHSNTIKVLEQTIFYSISNLFSGWDINFSSFEKVVRVSDTSCTRCFM